jgi:hypothetical protein
MEAELRASMHAAGVSTQAAEISMQTAEFQLRQQGYTKTIRIIEKRIA